MLETHLPAARPRADTVVSTGLQSAHSLGLTTVVQPAASGIRQLGADDSRVGIQGVIIRTTPSGSITTWADRYSGQT